MTDVSSADLAALTKEVHGLHNDIVYGNTQLGNKLDALLAAIKAGGTTTQASVTDVATTDAASKYFPTDPGKAAFPSPENSRMLREAAGISGAPYLVDSTGAVHQLVPATDAVPNGYTVNGAWAQGGGSDHTPMAELLVRQGRVYAQITSGPWQNYNPSMGSLYNASLPDAFATDAAGNTTSTVAPSSAKAPTLPVPQSPAPGTSGKVLTVGSGKQFSTITDAIHAAQAGDTIALDAGTYAEAPPVIKVPLYIKAVGGQAVVDCTGLTGSLAYGKGAFVPTADTILEGIRVTGVALDQIGAQLTCGVRPDVGCGYLTLRNLELDHNQSGLGTGGDLVIKIVVDGGHYHSNGFPVANDPAGHGRGFAHNIYTGAGTSLTLQNGFSSTTPEGGHAVKHRGYELLVSGCGDFDATEAAVFDVPNGSVGVATIDGATLTKPAGSSNHSVIDYGTDDISNGNGGMLVKNSALNLACDNPFFNVAAGSVITLDPSTKMTGNKPTAQGGTVKGL